MRSSSDIDPLSVAMAPPPGETPEQRVDRMRREAEAKRVSDAIDEELKAERAALKKKRKAIKILLLGQAESGKSTTLKNFQMMYASSAWKADRASWRAVIQLNLIRSVNVIVGILNDELSDPTIHSPPPSYAPSLSATERGPLQSPPGSDDEQTLYDGTTEPPIRFTDVHRMLRLRLTPLRRIEVDLKRRLGVPDEVSEIPSSSSRSDESGSSSRTHVESPPPSRARPKEATVRSWKGALGDYAERLKERAEKLASGTKDEATEVLMGCREDVKTLWGDAAVREMLRRRGVRMEETPGFFLDDIDRIVQRKYEPTDYDVVRARLRTTGVQEHWFTTDGQSPREDWVIYDVGGCRTLRRAWIPFFENVSAIIFLAPISCFDERLQEDRRVNRLEDTFLLWNGVVATKLLARTTIILFLNKIDLLERKIRAGVAVNHHLPSYGARPNEAGDVIKYLRGKFRDTHRRCSPEPRNFYCYSTTVINTEETQKTLDSIRDGILMGNLKTAEMIE